MKISKKRFMLHADVQYPFPICSPRTLDLPGSDLENVCVLRTSEDANKIAEESVGKNVVIIGTSFIGKPIDASLLQSCIYLIYREDMHYFYLYNIRPTYAWWPCPIA